MDVEEESAAFGETEVRVECDLCGRVFDGPDLLGSLVSIGIANVCVGCEHERAGSLLGMRVEET